jgi:hypothetical protein
MNHLTIVLENLKKIMSLNITDNDTFNQLLSPLHDAWLAADHQYLCHKLPDEQWVKSGILRVLDDLRTGCGFLQNAHLIDLLDASKSHYFGSFKSKRRLKHLESISKQLLETQSQEAFKQNPSADLHESLKNFHLYAGDGHFHAASSHDDRNDKSKKDAVGHLYALNLRNHLLSHLILASDGSKKKPHDMGVLKRMEVEQLKQGARKGQQVIYIWDRAGIDFLQWDKWKSQSGIYFVSRVKSNHVFQKSGHHKFDREDTINAGVVSDEQVGNGAGRMIRRITYIIPETGEEMQFITTLGHKVPPGVVVQLYFMRWRIEKSFDELKNKLYEQKAWSKSNEAKTMQAAFSTLAYNLAKLLNEKIEREEEIRDDRNEKKKEQRKEELLEISATLKTEIPSLRIEYQKASQLSVKFYRWLRVYIFKPSSWSESMAKLRHIYACF